MIDNRLGCCFTGYRPGKFSFAFNSSNKNYTAFEKELTQTIQSLYQSGTIRFFCGCAMGFDLLSGEIVLNLKKDHPEVELICMIPFKGQENEFTADWKERYYRVIQECDVAAVLSESYYKGCYRRRNCSMVDRSDKVLTFFDGKRGGTAETIRYASKNGLKIINLAEKKSKIDEEALQIQLELI